LGTRIRDDADYRQHMDYIHHNPVKHGYVTNPQNWQYSTLHKLIKKGVYPADWERTRMIKVSTFDMMCKLIYWLTFIGFGICRLSYAWFFIKFNRLICVGWAFSPAKTLQG
jgi:hypothetical protein